jgi:glutamate N-acetyltransferase/amino-acid N-acetyltransferase
MKVIEQGVCAPLGFKASGIHCGIKKRKLDLGLLVSQVPATTAAVFTTNKLYSPHIDIDKAHIKKARSQAVIVNSGNANCYNGRKGSHDAKAIVKKTAQSLKLKEASVLFASTGVIGKLLPLNLINKKIPKLIKRLSTDEKNEFAHAILTTDREVKQAAVTLMINNKKVTIGGCIKGAGMICPDMATTLCFLTTDALIKKEALKKALNQTVNNTLNMLTVEGDMSPNDSVIMMANGLAKNKMIDSKGKTFNQFKKALNYVLGELSKKLVLDAEGATKLIKIHVKGAKTLKDAKKAAFSVANSTLVKTAAYGEDPNWGRVVSAVGASRVYLKPQKVEVSFENVLVFKNMQPHIKDEDLDRLAKIFKKKEIDINVNLHVGKKEAVVLTCDLSKRYIAINAHYRT